MATEISKEKKIDILRFVNGYKRVANDKLREKYLSDNLKIVVNYVPFHKKMAICDTIIDATTHEVKRDLNGNIVYGENGKVMNGDFHVDSAMRFLLFTMNTIDLYTNLNVDFSNISIEYDYLDEVGLIPVIFALLPNDEISEIKTMLDMKYDDIMINEYNTKNYIKRLVNRFGDIIEFVLNMSGLDLGDLNNFDNEKLLNFAEQFIGNGVDNK